MSTYGISVVVTYQGHSTMQDGFTHRYGGKAGKRVHLILVCKFFVRILFFLGGLCGVVRDPRCTTSTVTGRV
jgi:hypothetical protein